MGDTSIMARRLPNGYVQYGWSGNGGYFSQNGFRILAWYNDDPELVEYLFSLGQTGLIGAPGSEKGGESWYKTHELTHEPCWLGRSEREIFSKIMFVNYGYFYDLDHKWYYIVPAPFRIKIPIEIIADYLEENDCEYEFDYVKEIECQLISYLLGNYYKEHEDFKNYFKDNAKISCEEMAEQLINDDFPVRTFYDNYKSIFKYFDDWVVVVKSDTGLSFKVRKKEENHVETIDWK